MDIDYKMINRLVSIFIDLDEAGQKNVIDKAIAEYCRMPSRQTGLTEERDIEEHMDKNFENIKFVYDRLCGASETDKAAIYIECCRLAYKGDFVPDTEVEVNVKMTQIPLRDIIEEALPNADYDEACRRLKELKREYQSK